MSLWDNNIFKDKKSKHKMESNLNILLRKIPVIYQSGKQEKGGTVILYAINNFMKQKIEKKT